MVPSQDKTKETAHLIDKLFYEMSRELKFQEKLIKYSDVAMVIIDRTTGQFVFANPSAERLYNRTLAELQELTLTSITEIESVAELQKGLDALSNSTAKSYKMAKVYIIPPDNKRKIAFMEIVEIATEKKFPFILGILIEKKQLELWLDMVESLG